MNTNEKICLIASSNKNKIAEVKNILQEFSYKVITPAEMACEIEVEETADTFEGNALLKAKAYHELFPDYYILADDSGLAIDALKGAPGIYSARYAGVGASYPEKFKKIWNDLDKTMIPEEEWKAKFICTIAWWEVGANEAKIFRGEFEGYIIKEARGEHGFGYDPIFYLPEFEKTSAEISPELKNSISHRGRALKKLQNYIREGGKN